jgi:hypothetical protein
MPTTIHARAAEEFALRLQQTEEGRRILAGYHELVKDPSHKEYVDAIGQPYTGWDIGQVAVLGKVHTLFANGLIGSIRVKVGAEPSQDAARDANRAKLQQLPDCFVTMVHDGLSHDGDGIFSWQPAVAEDLPGGWAKSAPLEIGHTDASRTFIHLAEHGVIARWPYGSEDIWLFGFTTFSLWAEWHYESFSFLEDGSVGQ